MKNFLIPTTFQKDTFDAVKTAVNYANGNACTIVLMTVSDVLDTYSAASLLRNLANTCNPLQEAVIDSCRAIVSQNPNCKLKFHNQYGISSPLIKNLLDFFDVDLVIIPASFKNADSKINAYCCQIISNYKRPILHITTTVEDANFCNAIYLENEKSNYPLENMQQFVQEQFALRIVSQAKISINEKNEQIIPLVSEAIAKNDVNIIIETRKPEKIKMKSKQLLTEEALGLPVLSIYEEVYS